MEFFFGGGTLWRGKRGARSRPENYGGEGGGLGRGGGNKRREGARSRLGDYGGGRLFGFV